MFTKIILKGKAVKNITNNSEILQSICDRTQQIAIDHCYICKYFFIFLYLKTTLIFKVQILFQFLNFESYSILVPKLSKIVCFDPQIFLPYLFQFLYLKTTVIFKAQILFQFLNFESYSILVSKLSKIVCFNP